MLSNHSEIDPRKRKYLGYQKRQSSVSQNSCIFIRGYFDLCQDLHGSCKRLRKNGNLIREIIRHQMQKIGIDGHILCKSPILIRHAKHSPVCAVSGPSGLTVNALPAGRIQFSNHPFSDQRRI